MKNNLGGQGKEWKGKGGKGKNNMEVACLGGKGRKRKRNSIFLQNLPTFGEIKGLNPFKSFLSITSLQKSLSKQRKLNLIKSLFPFPHSPNPKKFWYEKKSFLLEKNSSPFANVTPTKLVKIHSFFSYATTDIY